jgi:hypothetical protein
LHGVAKVIKLDEDVSLYEEEDKLPCFSALLKVVGSLFSAEADDESSHAAKNATMQSATKIFFIKILRPTATFIQWKYNYSLNIFYKIFCIF